MSINRPVREKFSSADEAQSRTTSSTTHAGHARPGQSRADAVQICDDELADLMHDGTSVQQERRSSSAAGQNKQPLPEVQQQQGLGLVEHASKAPGPTLAATAAATQQAGTLQGVQESAAEGPAVQLEAGSHPHACDDEELADPVLKQLTQQPSRPKLQPLSLQLQQDSAAAGLGQRS